MPSPDAYLPCPFLSAQSAPPHGCESGKAAPRTLLRRKLKTLRELPRQNRAVPTIKLFPFRCRDQHSAKWIRAVSSSGEISETDAEMAYAVLSTCALSAYLRRRARKPSPASALSIKNAVPGSGAPFGGPGGGAGARNPGSANPFTGARVRPDDSTIDIVDGSIPSNPDACPLSFPASPQPT